jgi:hypothetical protein
MSYLNLHLKIGQGQHQLCQREHQSQTINAFKNMPHLEQQMHMQSLFSELGEAGITKFTDLLQP